MTIAFEFSPYSAGMPSNDFCNLGVGKFLVMESGDGKMLFMRQVLVRHLCLDSVLTKWIKAVFQALIHSFPIHCTSGLNPRPHLRGDSHARNIARIL